MGGASEGRDESSNGGTEERKGRGGGVGRLGWTVGAEDEAESVYVGMFDEWMERVEEAGREADREGGKGPNEGVCGGRQVIDARAER